MKNDEPRDKLDFKKEAKALLYIFETHKSSRRGAIEAIAEAALRFAFKEGKIEGAREQLLLASGINLGVEKNGDRRDDPRRTKQA